MVALPHSHLPGPSKHVSRNAQSGPEPVQGAILMTVEASGYSHHQTMSAPNSNEAIAILIEGSHVINMLTRMSCGRVPQGNGLQNEALFCKVDNPPELVFLYKVSFSLIGLA